MLNPVPCSTVRGSSKTVGLRPVLLTDPWGIRPCARSIEPHCKVRFALRGGGVADPPKPPHNIAKGAFTCIQCGGSSAYALDLSFRALEEALDLYGDKFDRHARPNEVTFERFELNRFESNSS